MSDGWTRLTAPGMVNPALMDALQSRMEHGAVREDGRVDVDGFPRDVLEQTGEDPIPPGAEVVIRLRNGDLYCLTVAEQERVEREVKERHEQKERARERLKDWRARRAREFWKQYDIPIQYDVAIKGQRSGLLRDSSGTGRAADTVEHLFVREAFSDGRLERGEDVYLCDDSAEFRFDEGIRRSDSDGEQYIPPVTCQTCLKRMERWKVSENARGGGSDGS